MGELDYYSVMHKRIEYFAKKYDPLGRFSEKEEVISEENDNQKAKASINKLLSKKKFIVTLLPRISLTPRTV
jgi:hypothetical protein